MKKTVAFFSFLWVSGFLFPASVMAKGLGSAGSLTSTGLIIGLAVLGVIFLVFLGLLLLARVRELASLETEADGDKKIDRHPTSEDVMSLSESEIRKLIDERNLKTNPPS